MLYSIKKYIDIHKKGFLLLMIIVLIMCLCLCYKYAKYIENSRFLGPKTVSYKDVIVSEEEFPYQYLNNYDLNESYIDYINVNLNEYLQEEYVINEGGVYKLKGNLEGRIFINAKNEVVHLVLDGANIKSLDGPAIIVKNALQTIITLADESVNIISDSGDYRNSLEYESCIQSEEEITFNGNGSLNVYGLYKDAIRSRDTVKIVSGDISIQSKRTAIHGTDGINIAGGNVFVASEKNAFVTTKNGVNCRGVLMVSGGEITLIAGRYAFVSKAPIYVFNCNIIDKSLARFDTASRMYIQGGCINE